VGTFSYIARAAAIDALEVQAEVALGYLYGTGVPPNLDEASRWRCQVNT